MKLLLFTTLTLVSFASTSAAIAVESVPNGSNRTAKAEIGVIAAPEQTRFTVAASSITLKPEYLVEGQVINVSLKVTNPGKKKVVVTPSVKEAPFWLSSEAESTTLEVNDSKDITFKFTVGTIPANEPTATFKLVLSGETPSQTGAAPVTVSPNP